MKLDIIMPVHNEEAGIVRVAQEWARVIPFPFRFIFVEDGSVDDTLRELSKIAKNFNTLISSTPQRMGYCEAVVQGIRLSSAEMVLVVDSDGQCDPGDFPRFLSQFEKGEKHFVSGIRRPRRDSFFRRLASSLFHIYYRLLTKVKMKDPSCPYVLGPGESFRFLAKKPSLEYGYWWEFHLRRKRAGFSVKEIPVNHRKRSAGETKIYFPTKMLSIGLAEAQRLRLLAHQLQAERS